MIVTTLMAAGWDVIPATFVSELSSELMDKLVCLIIIFFVLKSMPARFVVKLPNGKYFLKEEVVGERGERRQYGIRICKKIPGA